MRTIEVDDEVYAALEGRAKPFVDATPNSVLRRILGLEAQATTAKVEEAYPTRPSHDSVIERMIGEDAGAPRRSRRRDVNLTPNRAYRLPILRALAEMGGRGRTDAILRSVYDQMKGVLTPGDMTPVPSGTDFTWRKRTQWERHTMVKEGLLRSDSPRGVWEITDKGRQYLGSHT